jgi:hypothetical protein
LMAALSVRSLGMTLVLRRSSSKERSAKFVVRTATLWRTGTLCRAK